MERAEWLQKIRQQTEALYDHLAPAYWVTFGFYANITHQRFIEKLLSRLEPHSALLDAACGAGRYDERLLEAGHHVLGIDQSGGMLKRAREHFAQERFPELSYLRIGLQEMDLQSQFDGAICIDAFEHVFPEDWPGILDRFHEALKPGGLFYFTVEAAQWSELAEAYERARAQGLPVVFGELVDQVDETYQQVAAQDWQSIPGAVADVAVYHYYPAIEQVRMWLDQAGLAILEEGSGDGYAHFLTYKK